MQNWIVTFLLFAGAAAGAAEAPSAPAAIAAEGTAAKQAKAPTAKRDAPPAASPGDGSAPARAKREAPKTAAPGDGPRGAACDDGARAPSGTRCAGASGDADEALTIAAAGDIMLGSAWPDEASLPPDEARGLLADVAPILSAADFTFGNLEGPLIDGGESRKCRPGSKNCYAFRMPTRYAARLAEAGFDAMTYANNHATDFGADGWASSRRALAAHQIAHTGEIGDVARFEVKGRRIALVGFATSPGMNDLRDLDAARALVTQVKADADLVFVTFHGGAEGVNQQHVPAGRELFLGEDRGDLRAFARAVIDAGAAAVIGHGPHVVRGLELYRGRLIAYSLGNFATYEKMNLSGPLGLSLVLEARIGADGRFLGGRIHPVKQVKPGGARRDPNGEIIPLVAQLSREDFGDAALVPQPDGILPAPQGDREGPTCGCAGSSKAGAAPATGP